VEMIGSPLVICGKAEYSASPNARHLALDDVMTVTRLDRLARSTRDVLNTLAEITDRKASFQSLRPQ
jgi:Resolvase, N terminal domain